MRAEGEPVGHVTTGEYGSQMLSLGGVNHLTHGGKKEGRVTCETLLDLCNGKAVELVVDGGASVIVEAGKAPIINGKLEERMRVGCGSATIGMFAKQWVGKVDEVVVVDDHITGVLSEHQAGKLLGMRDTGIRMKGRRSTPGRYFQVAEPGTGWGGTNISDPLDIVAGFNPKVARPRHDDADGLDDRRAIRLLSAGRGFAPCRGGAAREPAPVGRAHQRELRAGALLGALHGRRRRIAARRRHRKSGAPDALGASGADDRDRGGAPVIVWPGGGITFMVDVTLLPENAFGYVPTPAIVAPIEFTLRLDDYAALGGHVDRGAAARRGARAARRAAEHDLHQRRGGRRARRKA